MEAQAQLNDGDFFLVFFTIGVLEVEIDELLHFACKQTLVHFDGPLNLCDVIRVHDIQLRCAWCDVLELSCKDLDVVHGVWHPPLTHVAKEVVAPCASPNYSDARYDNAT